jgi:hypothetical protein
MHRGFTDLPSADPNPFPWAPTNSSEWKQYTIVLDNEQYLTEFFRVQFEFESRLGNNIYLDDINIQGIGGTQGVSSSDVGAQHWNLFPNPALDASTLVFQLLQPGSATVSVHDGAGRQISRRESALGSGVHQWECDAPKSPGVYMLTLSTSDDVQRTWRWAVR